ncbi:group III truncated hemoglobin [Ectothiorhodospiraceae bacterium 2226]|nr:group III truncated hemoglobin [Ectothiorhodospiraceae bacterium 2226]
MIAASGGAPPRRLIPLCDKIGAERVEAVVRAFYERLHADPELGPVFARIADFEAHQQRVIQFWWLAMGGRCSRPDYVDMVGVHRPVGVTPALLERWLALFDAALEAELPPELAREWSHMAHGIGGTLRNRLGLGG